MAEVNKIASFKSFSEVKSQENTMKLKEENNLKKQETLSKIEEILDEMGLSSLSEIDEDSQKTFISKILGREMNEGNAFVYAAAKAKAAGEKEFEFNGKTYKVTIKDTGVKESEEAIEEGNAFVYAAAKAKAAGEKEFEFNGKTYKVTIKDTGVKESEEAIEEGNAFGDAVRKAKEAGETEFEFEGETFKVEESEVNEGTRGQFGKIDKAGNIVTVYTHADSYPENMLPIIKKSYKNAKKVDTVIAKGDMSGLQSSINAINFYGSNTVPYTGNVNKIENFIKFSQDNAGAEYIYLFDERDNTWYMVDIYGGSKLVPAFESVITEGKDDYVARYSGTNITLKKGYKHHTEEELQKLYNKIGELVKDDLKVKDVTIVFESLVNEHDFKVGDKVKMSHGGSGVVKSLDKESGADDEKYYNVELPSGEVHKHSPNELTKESIVTEAKGSALQDYVETVSQKTFKGGGNGQNLLDEAMGLAGHIDSYALGRDTHGYEEDGFYGPLTITAFKKLVDQMSADDIKNNQADKYESAVTEAKPAGLSKEETLKVAQKFADAIAEVDGVKVTVNMKTLEEDSFDLDYDGTEFDGGSYNINDDGSVVNMAVRKQPTVGTKDDDVKTIVKFMKKHYGKLAKESAVTEAEKIEVGTFVRYKKDKDFTGGKIKSIKGSNAEIHNWDGSTTELPLKDLEYVKSWNESAVTEAIKEVVLSNEILDFLEERGILKTSDAQKVHKDLTAFLKEKGINESVNEASRRATDFYGDSKYGKSIDLLLKGKWDSKKVENFLDKLGDGNDVKYARIIDFISGDAGLNIRKYKNIGEQLPDLMKQLEVLYKDFLTESVEVNEAEIKSDDEFKEYAFAVLKKAFGEDFDETKGQSIVDGILGKVDGDYGAAVGMLTSSLG